MDGKSAGCEAAQVSESQITDLRLLGLLMRQDQGPAVLIEYPSLRYLAVNPAACELLGYTEDALTRGGLALDPFVPLDVLEVTCADLVAQSPLAQTANLRLQHRDGSILHGQVTRQAVVSEGRWVILEVISNQSAEKEAMRERDRLRVAVDQMDDFFSLVDPETFVQVDINERCARELGKTRAAMIGHKVLLPASLGEKGYERLRALYQDLIDTGRTDRTEDSYPVAGGGQVPVEILRRAILSDGKWLILLTGRNISDRKAARARLERFRAAVDEAADAILLVDPEQGKFIDINETAARLLGYAREQLMEMHTFQISTDYPTQESTLAFYRELVARYPESIIATGCWVRADGSTIEMEFSRRAVRSGDEWIVVVAARDISERRRTEEAIRRHVIDLTRSNQELAQFAYVASHDLSEPLRMVGSYTQLLERRYGDRLDAEGREFMAYVISGARRMKQLIDDLLAYSRVGRHEGKAVRIRLDGALDLALSELSQAVVRSGAIIERMPLPNDALYEKSAMVQLFQHLVGNALKFTGNAAPRIRIDVKEDTTGWEIAVSDNGIGIEEQYRERIFVIFQRLHSRDRFEGTGIGLAICKKIVESHGGRIWVESRLGQGSSFKFWLPR